MVDTTDTPPAGPATGDAPAAPRRRGPGKATTAAKAPSTRRKAAPSTVDQAEAAVKATATRVKRGAAKAEGAVVDAAKDAVKVVTPRGGRGKAKAATKTTRKSPSKKAGRGKWGVAAIAGGLAAAGAAAALLSLRGSSAAKGEAPADPSKGAHQPDGSDSSKSFQAGIADENSVPN